MSIITKLDHYGRGIVYDNDKITFISNALINEDVEYRIIRETKKYNEGIVTKYKTKSNKRAEPKCPYYNVCGGCSLQHMNYEETISFKKQKIQEILFKYANIDSDIEVIKNEEPYYYRNKISLKVKNKKIGFYKNNSHDLIEISKCLIAKKSINDVISCLKSLNISNGNITIRSNYNDEILIIIDSKDDVIFKKDNFNNIKLVGVVLNNKMLYGEDKFIDIINNTLFQVSYNSFFQVNSYVTSRIFDFVSKSINNNALVADLFCGVGTLGIIASKKAKKVYGIEIIPNAIKNALINSRMNKVNNIEFLLGDANKSLLNIKDDINTIIVDPPRSGLSKDGLNAILEVMPQDIIYISCDPMTLARDLNILKNNYQINKVYIADMFSYTYHCESITVLERR